MLIVYHKYPTLMSKIEQFKIKNYSLIITIIKHENLKKPSLTQNGEFIRNRFISTLKFKLPLKFWFITRILFSNTNNNWCDVRYALYT